MTEIAIALNRFGLGGRPDEAPPGDAKRWLLGQLDRFEPRPPSIAAAPQRQTVVADLADFYEEQRGQAQLRRAAGGAGRRGRLRMQPAAMKDMPDPEAQPGMAQMPDAMANVPDQARRFVRRQAHDYYLNLVGARTNAALAAPAPFVERLVHFWANHFAVSADKLTVIGLAGLLEFEAIRPHVLGKFSDMLMAVERHPAMLLYLDQAVSIGPDSTIGRRIAQRGRQRGLNENLAREILELHTLGVNGGYAQADVTEFARALTGWTVAGITRGPGQRFIRGAPGEFAFVPMIHEPGPRTIMGRNYAQEGEAQATAVLADLAAHPATARHLATKLARHFAGDAPPPAMVQRLEQAYLRSGGDLPAVYRALIDSPEAWTPAPAKFRSPWDWSLAALRAVGTREVQPQPAAGLLTQLGQPVWRPGSPAGFDDIDANWSGPDALMRRVEAAERLAGRTAETIDARRLAPRLLPGAVSDATVQAIARAESSAQGLALLLVSPEFLRR
ncbi:DUF1800 domain-containing protein [Sphingosinicella sp. LHD-64]|uniref:DUF1800 domain-containing protein n=1 Tax=Sphingosinicella sp. LHD-64 TaxID=3072139 RepID=UPI00280CCF3E|nr:DUF1800 domain-containing protein [Sphingosinicella sp. LHD-64]MDQ8758230.1 DUF1800 domain-containing protein [Sphingosinicella sp. LHD-64]